MKPYKNKTLFVWTLIPLALFYHSSVFAETKTLDEVLTLLQSEKVKILDDHKYPLLLSWLSKVSENLNKSLNALVKKNGKKKRLVTLHLTQNGIKGLNSKQKAIKTKIRNFLLRDGFIMRYATSYFYLD